MSCCPALYRYVLMSWDVNASYKSWNKTTKALSTLPAIDTFGTIYTTDGEELCKLDSNGVPPAPCIKMEPITGPLFDITIVADKFIYLLYKNGFMVAYTTGIMVVVTSRYTGDCRMFAKKVLLLEC